MIAGRFHWKTKPVLPKSKNDLAAFRFEHGTMLLTEASPKKRAGLWCLSTLDEVEALGAGGVNALEENDEMVRDALLRSNNTLKRALADPSRFDGIGNAYSDEILHDARLSPLKRTRQLTDDEVKRLIASTRRVLGLWIERLQEQTGQKFPEKVTAFRPEMAVHGKFGEACPLCAAPVQRIRYANNECNYCPGCQTEGRILADRSLSRLLKEDWPKSLDELEDSH
jgi:formamidopyrimidine-DNA glycosylase